jgi:pimeloyl-ACP methyl ester carboxylesterase
VTTTADDQRPDPLLPGIAARSVRTSRLTSNVLYRSDVEPGSIPLVLVHGNVSSALFWQPLMVSLPDEINAFAVDLRGFGDSETAPVDATRGLSDFSDDVADVVSALGLADPHLVGWSMGGGVVMQYAIDHVAASLTLISPVSPYGFGGTALDGTLLTADAAAPAAAAPIPTSWPGSRPATVRPTRRPRRAMSTWARTSNPVSPARSTSSG